MSNIDVNAQLEPTMTIQAVPASTLAVYNVPRSHIFLRWTREKRVDVVVAAVRFLGFVSRSVMNIRIHVDFTIQPKVQGSSFAQKVFIFTAFDLLLLFILV